MTHEDIIRFGEQADEIADRKINMRGEYHPKRLWFWRDLRDEAFAELVAAHEREACARVCEETEVVHEKWCVELYDNGSETLMEAAKAIRARGEQPPIG